MNKNKQAFTLVELIVVITILAILGTIAFISLQGYSASSRDSVRISDVSSMKTSLELFHLDAGKYPLPDNPGEVKYGLDTLWSQGTLGKTVVSQLSRSLNKIPTDPLTDKEYVFSVSGYRNDFQILNLLEGDLAISSISQTNAANTKRTPRIDGKYNGLFLKTPNYIFPTPSLITSEPLTGGLTINDANISSQIITGGENIPNIGNINSATGKLNIKLSVYTGVINGESIKEDKIAAITAIKGAYSGSTLANSDIYKTILNTEGDDALVALADTIILDKTSKTTTQTPSDTEAPTGGDFTMPATTSSTNVTLTITCPEEEGVEMFISGTGVLSGGSIWEECAGSKIIILTNGFGNKTISMKWKDSLDNETGVTNKVIELMDPGLNASLLESTHRGILLADYLNTIPDGHWVLLQDNTNNSKKTRFKKHIDFAYIRGHNYVFQPNAVENFIGGVWVLKLQPYNDNYIGLATPSNIFIGGGGDCDGHVIIGNGKMCYDGVSLLPFNFTVFDGGAY